jgi:hypothetical protein
LRWLVVVVLALQAHFAASYLVPLDREAQGEFGGLLRWVWPWAHGDGGPLGRITEAGFPLPGFFLAATAGAALLAAALAVAGWWVPTGWWRPLAIAGAGLLLVLMALFLGPTKVLPILLALATLYLAIAAPGAVAPR